MCVHVRVCARVCAFVCVCVFPQCITSIQSVKRCVMGENMALELITTKFMEPYTCLLLVYNSLYRIHQQPLYLLRCLPDLLPDVLSELTDHHHLKGVVHEPVLEETKKQ